MTYSIVIERTNYEQPIISSQPVLPIVPNASTILSPFFYNFNPTALQMPDGGWALIFRSVRNKLHPATKTNPDFLTLTRVRSTGDAEGRGAIVLDPINESSIILASTPEEPYDDMGLQDPRVLRDPSTGTYWLTYTSWGSKYDGTGIAKSDDGLHWKKVARCDADHTHPFKSPCGFGRSAAMLYRDVGEHYMVWSAGGPLNIARSVNRSLAHWRTVTDKWLAGFDYRGAWVNPGGSPVRLSDGNYLFLHVEAGNPRPPLRVRPEPCPWSPPGYKGYWGIGWAILNGTDPAHILQRGSELLFPTTKWELERRTSDSEGAYAWMWRGCMIGDASGLQPLPHARDPDTFMVYYGGGDSVSGAAVIRVRKQ